MADPVYLEVKVSGTGLVESGVVSLALLEEELDHAAQVTVELSPDDAVADVIASLTFGAPFSVELGKGTSPTRTVSCTLTETEDELDSGGRWHMVVRGVDDMVKLKQKVQSQLLEVSPQAALQQLIADQGLTASLSGIEAWTQPLLQNNESSASFIRKLAEDFRYTATLDGTTLRLGRTPDSTTVNIGPDDGLERVRVRRSLADIPSKVTVMGYDWKGTQAAVTGQAASGDQLNISGGTTAAALVQQTWGEVELLVESERLLQAGDADALARGTLQRKADRFIDGVIECLGQPDARPGRTLVIANLGAVDGTYRIRATRHQLDAVSGYRTTIWFYSDSLPPVSA